MLTITFHRASRVPRLCSSRMPCAPWGVRLPLVSVSTRLRCSAAAAFHWRSCGCSRAVLAILCEEGVLEEQGRGEYIVRRSLPEGDAVAQCQAMLEQFPAFHAEIKLLSRCGANLADVVRGKQDPLQLLFPAGDTTALEDLYRGSPSAKVHNELVRRAIAGLVGSGGRPLRVLEIGAGTGATTHHALEALPAGTEYTFTDISPAFVTRAARTFAGRAGMQYRTLDIDDRTLAEQGFGGESFDLIVAANVLHATRDLTRTVRRVRELLKPGGSLVLLEGTLPLRWVDLTFGMTEGWWRFTDRDLRPAHPLLTPAQWLTLLKQNGFDDVERIPQDVEAAGQSLILARAADAAGSQSAAPVVTATRWLICADCIDVARTFAASCERAGIEYALVSRSAETGLRAREYQASASSDVERVFDRLANERFEPAVVVFIAAESAPSLEAIDTVRADCLAATAWLRKLGNARHAARLWVVTRGAQPVADTSPTQFAQAGLWGWGRVASLEKPELFGGLVDAEPDNLAWANVARDVIASPGSEDQFGIRRGQRFVPRLARAASAGSASWRCDPNRRYLVTGWMGGLGQLLVQWLADRGARHLTLVGRRDLSAQDAEASRLLESLRDTGVNITLGTASVADKEAMRPWSWTRRRHRPHSGASSMSPWR